MWRGYAHLQCHNRTAALPRQGRSTVSNQRGQHPPKIKMTMDLSIIRRAVSAFGSRAIQAGYLANPEMRRSSRGKSRGDFRRNREDYSQYKCTIAIVYDTKLSFAGSEQWDELMAVIKRALHEESYWIKEIVTVTTEELSTLKEKPLMTIQVEEHQVVLKDKDNTRVVEY